MQNLRDAFFGWQKHLTFPAPHPPVEGPAVEVRRNEASRSDKRKQFKPWYPDRCPVSMSKIDMGDGERAGQKRAVGRVKLPLDPERPHPVEVMLNRLCIDQPSGVHDHAGTQQFNRFGHFRRLIEMA